MSGIEVAGIVLAVLPLCISALEHYEDQLTPYKALFHYQTELSERSQELEFVYTSFVQTIQNLYAEAGIADDEEFEEMLDDKTARTWPSDDWEGKLRQYPNPRIYRTYKVKASKIYDMIVNVASILGADVSSLLKTVARG